MTEQIQRLMDDLDARQADADERAAIQDEGVDIVEQWRKDAYPDPARFPGIASRVLKSPTGCWPIRIPTNGSAVLERDETPQESFIEPAHSFLSVEDPALEYVIPELTPRGVLKLSHGDPRTMKSLAALEEAIAAATGTPAFGMERLRPVRAYRALYCSQEDAAPIVRPRVKKMLRARGIESFPDTLAFAVYKGIDFDNPEWQERFFEEAVSGGFDLVTIDPARGFTAFADSGPKEVLPLAKFFRRLTSRGITVHVVHHDTKPPSNGPDNRRRSHRASGGGWFSVSECPVSFEKIGDGVSLVSPEDYKLSSDPQPFTITYKEDDRGIQLIGENTTSGEAATLAIDDAVITYLNGEPGASGRAITRALRKGAGSVSESLERLYTAGKVDCVDGPKRAKLWTVKG